MKKIANEFDKKIYEEEIFNFIPEKIIDAHSHVWKKEFAREVDGVQRGVSGWLGMVANECYIEELLSIYQEIFPQKEVTPVIFGMPTEDLEKNNSYVEAISADKGLTSLFCTDYTMSGAEIENAVKHRGFKGIKPYVNNSPQYIPSKEIRIFDFLTPEHLEVANELSLPVMLHIGRDGRLGDPVNIAQLMEIDNRYPNVKLIVAHIGRAYAKEDLGNAFDVLKDSKNMVFDFSANTLDYAIEKCIEAVGSDRVLFGSDLPITKMRMARVVENGMYINIVPKGAYGDVSSDSHMRESDRNDLTLFLYEEILAFKRAATKLNLSTENIKDIFYNNAVRVYSI